jgi:hypothetical protein
MALSGAQLVEHADRVAYGVELLEHRQHQVRDVGPGDGQAVRRVAVYRGSVPAGERSVGQPRWSDRAPVQAPVALFGGKGHTFVCWMRREQGPGPVDSSPSTPSSGVSCSRV